MTNSGPIRLTLDDNLRAVPAAGVAFQEWQDGLTFLENKVVLELKFLRVMPGLFKLLVEEFALSPTSVSKYRLAATALDLVPTAVGSAVESADFVSTV